MAETELDKALEVARGAVKDAKDPGNTHANYFYDTFLNSVLFVPVLLEGKQTGDWSLLGLEDRFNPMFVKHDGAPLIPVFDLLERLKEWASDRQFDYLEIKTHVFVQLLGPKVSLVLNPGTPWNYAFTSQILSSLRNAMRPISPN
jgi:hypothetical protein